MLKLKKKEHTCGSTVLVIAIIVLTTMCIDTTQKSMRTKGTLIITTDKTEYEQGETINITLLNKLDKPNAILFFTLNDTERENFVKLYYGQAAFLGFLEKFENNTWIKIVPLERMYFEKIIYNIHNYSFATDFSLGENFNYVCDKFSYNGRFEATEIRNLIWRQKIFVCDVGNDAQKQQMDGGRYRIITITNETIFSNEFIIKS